MISNRKPRSLPLDLWPQADRRAWTAACEPAQRLKAGGRAGHLKPVTRDAHCADYGNFLGFLDRSGWLERNGPAAANVVPEKVSAYIAELKDLYHRDPVPLLRILERENLIVGVEPGRFYAVEAVERLATRLRDGMTEGREYSPSELREVLGVSRKYLIPFLEYCDRKRITERRVTGRVRLPSNA